jgi:hypothetical protein
MKVPYWLDEDGDYWVDAEKTPDPIEAAGMVWFAAEALDESDDGNAGQMWLVGRTTQWLKDCPMDHDCDYVREEDTDACYCDNHEETPCVPEVERDVWHLTTYPVEGARHLTDSDIFHSAAPSTSKPKEA